MIKRLCRRTKKHSPSFIAVIEKSFVHGQQDGFCMEIFIYKKESKCYILSLTFDYHRVSQKMSSILFLLHTYNIIRYISLDTQYRCLNSAWHQNNTLHSLSCYSNEQLQEVTCPARRSHYIYPELRIDLQTQLMLHKKYDFSALLRLLKAFFHTLFARLLYLIESVGDVIDE